MVKPKIVTRVGAVVTPLEFHKKLNAQEKDTLDRGLVQKRQEAHQGTFVVKFNYFSLTAIASIF